MNKQKGFTVIELLAVIIVLSLLITLVTPSLLNPSKAAKERSYQTKVKMIETSAIMFAQDNYLAVTKNTGDICNVDFDNTSTEGIVSCTINVDVLIKKEYLEADGEEDGTKIVENPKDNSYLNENNITIEVNTETKKITAEFQESTT